MEELGNNIYLKSLEFGYSNSQNGCSLNKVVEKLNISFENESLNLNYRVWFYNNFYNGSANSFIKNQASSRPDKNIYLDDKFNSFNSEASFIKGEALSRYIDYIELSESRKSSNIAKIFSIVSIIIASLSIIAPIIANKYSTPSNNIIIPSERNEAKCCEHKCSRCPEISNYHVSDEKAETDIELQRGSHVSNESQIDINIK